MWIYVCLNNTMQIILKLLWKTSAYLLLQLSILPRMQHYKHGPSGLRKKVVLSFGSDHFNNFFWHFSSLVVLCWILNNSTFQLGSALPARCVVCLSNPRKDWRSILLCNTEIMVDLPAAYAWNPLWVGLYGRHMSWPM